jgi:serine O-acetyltransferase
MRFAEFRELVFDDVHRYAGRDGWGAVAGQFRIEPGFRITFWMRLSRFLRSRALTRWGAYHFAQWRFHAACRRAACCLDFTTEIGGGLYLPHAVGIVVNRRVVIGRNCNLSQHVTLGVSNRGPKQGNPVLGDRVYLGPGAVVFGAVTVGEDAAVGANAVVNRDVPPHTVVAGLPARPVSDKGSEGYINSVRPHE